MENLKTIREDIDALKSQNDADRLEIERYSKRIHKRISKISKLEDEYHASLPEKNMEYYLFEDGSINGARYEDRRKFIANEFPGLYQSGYNPETQQINLVIVRKDDLDIVIESLIKADSVFTKSPSKLDGKVVSRFTMHDRDLSANGTYLLEIFESQARLLNFRYSRDPDLLKDFKPIPDMVKYLDRYVLS